MLIVAGLLVACSQPAPSTSQGTTAPTTAAASRTAGTTTSSGQASGGTLNVAIADLGTENMDVTIPQVNNVIPLIYEPLLRYDPQGNLVPWLAESSQMSRDGKLWTFNLRKGVKWNNGDDLTSDDVKFSFQRFIADDRRVPGLRCIVRRSITSRRGTRTRSRSTPKINPTCLS